MKGLTDKVAIVAGGGQGMGAAAARRLAGEGSKVVVGDLRAERAEAVVSEIVGAGGTAVAQQFDLSDSDSVKALIGRAVEDFGGVDLLANVGANVGPVSAIQDDTDAVSISTETWEATMSVNVRGYLFTARHAIPEMIKRGGGAIVSVSSAAAAIPMPQQVAYAVSKAGVEALTRHIASRWAQDGIRANSVAPGLIHTPTGDAWLEQFGISPTVVSPLGRGGQPDEVGALIAFLLSEECAFVNGQSVAVNGGSFMSPQ
jgi:NAD(P)-dependent dehydrogenase (short-subunit alcohol dehydrogenase family)